MSGPSALERGYRRLLAFYPQAFRREHEEEMLAVLLAGARPGQQRAGLAEVVNLITCGLRMRLRSRWVVAAALPCAAAIAMLGYTLVGPQAYASTAAVTVTAPAGTGQTQQTPGGAVETATINLDTEAQRVTSETVTMLAAHLMHSSLALSQLSRRVTVSVPRNSAVLDITCHAPTATEAHACAKAFAKAYVQTRDASLRRQASRYR